MTQHTLALPTRARGPAPRGGWLAAVVMAVAATLSACGGGGGAGAATDAGSGTVATPGALKVTVTDTFGAPVPGATVRGLLGASAAGGATDAQGVALVATQWPAGTAEVTVTRQTFVAKTLSMSIATGQVNELAVVLDRAVSAAGGSAAPAGGPPPVVDGAGQQLSFEVDLIVVDEAALPVPGLTAANFALRACAPDPATERADCVVAAGGAGAAGDAAYAPPTSSPDTVQRVDGAGTRPYAAALLMDQSGSIATSDPTGARLFSAKALIGGLGAGDQALLAAFAGAPGALIPAQPLSQYGGFYGPATATGLYPTLDALVPLVGGSTPLYASLDALRAQLAGDSSLPAGIARAIVVFTDGADTDCGSAATCAASRAGTIARARADGVRIVTVGLGPQVDVEALADLSGQTGGMLLYADTAEQLIPLYGSVGRLLSQSAPAYRLRFTVQAGAAGTFQSGGKLLGRVQVTLPGRQFDVPVVVAIP